MLKLFPKEQRCCPADFGLGEFFERNDLVVNVYVLQAEQFGGECVFWKFLNAIFQMIRRWSAIMWEFHMTLWPFLAKTLEAGHPKDLERHVDPTMHEVLMDNSHRPPYLLACRRIEFIKKYTQLAQTSRAEELKLRLNMPARIRKLMTGKRLYLLGTMLVDLGFPDHDLLRNLCNGF